MFDIYLLGNEIYIYMISFYLIFFISVLLDLLKYRYYEYLIYDDSYITIGANHDLQSATKLPTSVLYNCGFGESSAFYGNNNRDAVNIVYDHDSSILNTMLKELLYEGKSLAHNEVLEQKQLLLKLSDYLSDHRTLDKNQLKSFIESYSVNFDINTIVENADNIYYRNKPKEEIKK